MASSTIQFFVPGIPKPGGSKHATLHSKTGRVIVMEDCKKNKDWRASGTYGAIEAHGFDADGTPNPLMAGPLSLDITFWFNRPKSHYGTGKNANKLKPSAPRWHTQAPDSTKLVRSTEDALTKVLWIDDSQVCEQRATKTWIPRDAMPGAMVKVRKLNGET